MSLERRQKQILALKRLVIAGVTFDHVKLLCSHIQQLGRQTFTPLHVPLFAGVCVTYMKPFVRCDGLGPLPQKFQKFPHAEGYRKAHNDLKNARDWYYAHRDMLKAPNLLSNRDSRAGFEDVILHVEESGISYSINEQSWSISSVSRVRNLCDYQKARIDKDIQEIFTALRQGKRFNLGTYTLGRDFP